LDEDGKLVYLLSNGQALNWANKHGIKGNGRPTKYPAAPARDVKVFQSVD
jgi:hypothetical protein